MYNRSNRCQTSCNQKNNTMGCGNGRSMYNQTMMNPSYGAGNNMRNDYGHKNEMGYNCKKEMDYGCKKEMDYGCKKEMDCGCEVEPNCGCGTEKDCGCNMDMNYGCEDNRCASQMSHEEFYCLLHQLLQYEEGADAEFCKAKKELQEVLGHLQYGIGCNTKIAELYCMINEWLDCYDEENNYQCNCNNNCRNMRCELNEMVESIHNKQKESCSHAYAAFQCLMEAMKLNECMLEFREKVMKNCYPRQCK